MASASNVVMPVLVDCFMFNQGVFSPEKLSDVKMAPITQPNYTFLRYDRQYLANDIMRHVDLHGSGKATSNPRYTDLGTEKPFENRQGVYVHWMVPRPYRSGIASTKSGKSTENDGDQPVSGDAKNDQARLGNPKFPTVPSRWLVVRHIHSVGPADEEALKAKLIPEVTGWVVESSHLRNIDQLERDIDLQTDVSPYITPKAERNVENGNEVDNIEIGKQAEMFLGSKWPADSWTEDGTALKHEHVNLDLSSSSNQLFADYQPHNSNVFSIIDTLQYQDGPTVRRINSADISYYVIGWNSDESQDLFYTKGESLERGSRLDSLRLQLRETSSQLIKKWREDHDPIKSICHGARYNIQWHAEKKPSVPGDSYGSQLMKESMLSVGTTPLDSIIAFAKGQIREGEKDIEIDNLLQDLKKLEAQVVARDDGVEGQLKAASDISSPTFKRHDGGKHVYFADTSSRSNSGPQLHMSKAVSEPPTEDQKKVILELNLQHQRSDAAERLSKKLRWDMFALWWSLLSDLGTNEPVDKVEDLRARLLERATNVINAIKPPKLDPTGKSAESKVVDEEQIQTGVLEPFFQPSDPLLLVAGVPSAWPHDYLDKLTVRLQWQIVDSPNASPLPDPLHEFSETILPTVIPHELLKVAQALVKEFHQLHPATTAFNIEGNQTPPLYHDHPLTPDGLPDESQWRDRWYGQPFFPLYLEWEVHYVHVPYRYWKAHDTSLDDEDQSKLRYTIQTTNSTDRKSTLDDPSGVEGEGERVFAGRSLILPQPGFSLESKVLSLFSQLAEDPLEKIISKDVQEKLIGKLRHLPFLSTHLTGFTDHLITRLQGTHVKPNNRSPTGSSIPIQGAIDHARNAGTHFSDLDLRLIAEESDVTPYSSTFQLKDRQVSAFKPVTHGQFRFTKLNIIDKFGQAIHAIDPAIKEKPVSTKPCSGEYFAPQVLFRDSEQETVAQADYCYLQIPPQINQPARLNASFVDLTPIEKGRDLYWKPTSEWDNPVWGWIIINYANYGLQFFLGDGTFYREVRVGGPGGSLASPEWLPFEPKKLAKDNPLSKDPRNQQLDNLVKELGNNAGFLRSFVTMIDKCMATLVPAPASYSEQMSSVVGRPLALVNTGWSLELAVEPYNSQMIDDLRYLPLELAKQDSLSQKPEDPVYEFAMKLGSREKAHEATVGYFPVKGQPKLGDAIDLQQLYTYYGDFSDKRMHKINDGELPKLKAFYYDPTLRSESILDILRCSQQKVFATIMDPFASIHAYTSLLPTKELKLPPWITQSAFSKMTTFFRIGPLLLTRDVPPLNNPDQRTVDEVAKPVDQPELSANSIPASELGTWNWFQPYYDRNSEDDKPEGTEKIVHTRFKLDKVDHRLRFEEAPYTATEGYLQLCEPSEQAKGQGKS
jgi:hypothetical protein